MAERNHIYYLILEKLTKLISRQGVSVLISRCSKYVAKALPFKAVKSQFRSLISWRILLKLFARILVSCDIPLGNINSRNRS